MLFLCEFWNVCTEGMADICWLFFLIEFKVFLFFISKYSVLKKYGLDQDPDPHGSGTFA